MMLTTISSNPSSIVITGSMFLLTLIRSSFSSLCVHHIRQAPSFSRHRPNIQTAPSHAVTVQIPHTNDIYGDYIFSASKRKSRRKLFNLFTGSFKTGPTGLLGRLEGFTWCGTKTDRNCKPASFLWRKESDHNGLVLISYGMDRNCLNRLWRICINTNCENQNDWLDYWSGRKIK